MGYRLIMPKTTLKKALVICCIILGLTLYLWICYEVNYTAASKMSWWELILSAIGMICGLWVVLFLIWMGHSLCTGTAYPFESDGNYD